MALYNKGKENISLGGVSMKELMKLASHPLFMWYFGILGDALLIVGIVTAAKEASIAGFTPMTWFLLAIACYLGMVWVVTLRILLHLENRTGNQQG